MAAQAGKKKSQPANKETSKWKWPSIGVIALVVAAAAVFLAYYVRTPAETVVIVPAPLPPDWSAGFTKEELGESFLASIQEIRIGAKSKSSEGSAGLQVASPVTLYTAWASALPSFDQEVHKVTLNMVRQWALTAKAKHFLHLNAIKSDQGFRLLATLQSRPDFGIQRSWRVPSSSNPCDRPDLCTAQLAEDVMAWREPHTLVLYYLNQQSAAASAKIVDLYQSGEVSASEGTDYFAWGDALRGLKRYDHAILKYGEALNKSKLCAAYDAIGVTNIRKYEQSALPEDLESAAASYRKALTCNPQDALAHCDLGNVFMRKWKLRKFRDDALRKRAVAENEAALGIDPTLVEAAVNIGWVRYMQGLRPQALDYFRRLTKKFPDSPVVFVNFGYLLFNEYVKGQTNALQEALDTTRSAWSLDRDHKNAVTADNLAVLYYETDDLADAVKLWERAHELEPTSDDILGGYALGLFKYGDPTKAIGYYQEAVRRSKNQMRNADVLRTKYLWTEKAIRDVAALDQAAFPPQ